MIITKIGKKFQSSWRAARAMRNIMCYSTEDKPLPEIPRNEIEKYFTASLQKENGIPYDKKPFKIRLEAGKLYCWCLCGQGHGQPFCDGTHKNIFMKIKLRPIKFQVKETKDYWLCNCKQTMNRPFCDGSHLSEKIQELKI